MFYIFNSTRICLWSTWL